MKEDYMGFVKELRERIINELGYDKQYVLFRKKGSPLSETGDRLIIIKVAKEELLEYHALDTRELYEDIKSNKTTMQQVIHDISQEASQYNEVSCTERLLLQEDYEKVRRFLIIRLKNPEYHKEDIRDAIYEELDGISLTVYLNLGEKDGNMVSVAVDKDYLEFWGISKEELIRETMKNTMQLAPPRIYKWENWISDLNYQGEEFLGIEGVFEKNPRYGSYCLSTSKKINGAVAIYMDGVAEKLAEILEDDLFLAFTSMHEVMIHPVSRSCPEVIKDTMKGTQERATKAEDFLTEYLYFYSRDTKQIMRYMGEKFIWQKTMNK